MSRYIKNLVFGGAGVLGIAYFGALDYLYNNNKIKRLEKVAGSSAGAITACLTSLNLPFEKFLEMANLLDFKKVLEKKEHKNTLFLSKEQKNELQSIFGDIDCITRLVKDFGWYSTEYFYNWLKEQIALQFIKTKKSSPYTFADFKNADIHFDNRPFLDLYIIGTDVTNQISRVFSYETTPNMEVAKAVTISMSIPLFFTAIKTDNTVFVDGGVLRNYPINLFDTVSRKNKNTYKINYETLGLTFKSSRHHTEIKSLLDYIKCLITVFQTIQNDILINDFEQMSRSIIIDHSNISPMDFNISANDKNYIYLYTQGYNETKKYFK